MSVSVLILTRNEEVNIAACLKTVAFSDDVVVFDSMSTDQTVALSRQFPNVRVIQRPFDNWAAHQNWAMENITFKHPWVFYLDADERMTPELSAEVLAISQNSGEPRVAFYCGRRNIFMDRWIRHAMPPGMIMRFFRPPYIRFERLVNPVPVIRGDHGYLRHQFEHYNFSKGLGEWFSKHNNYSGFEAQEARKVRRQHGRNLLPLLWKSLIAKDRAERRQMLKAASFLAPGRAFLRFLASYLLRLGLLDGVPGFRYASMISVYEYWIALKTREAENDWKTVHHELTARRLSSTKPWPDFPPTIDVIIPTLNQAQHIQEVVANARKIGRVFVLDSLSTDGTQELARQAGATVIEHAFEGYAQQKNWALDNLPLTGQWVFIIDADERITPELATELHRIVTDPHARDGYYINRQLLIMGQTIRHGGLYPSWNLRFFRRGHARYEDRSVHEHMVCTGRTGYLRPAMLHLRLESMSDYIAKHIRYADLESDEWIKAVQGKSRQATPTQIFRRTLLFRQRLRRYVWPHIPGRPLWRFVYMYFVRLGFLDGRAGWDMAMLMASYELMISYLYFEKLAKIARPAPTAATSAPATPTQAVDASSRK